MHDLNFNLAETILHTASYSTYNGIFGVYRLNEYGYPLMFVLDFKVGNKRRICKFKLDGFYYLDNNEYVKIVSSCVQKLLNEKETIRICTKFWTGVEIE